MVVPPVVKPNSGLLQPLWRNNETGTLSIKRVAGTTAVVGGTGLGIWAMADPNSGNKIGQATSNLGNFVGGAVGGVGGGLVHGLFAFGLPLLISCCSLLCLICMFTLTTGHIGS